MLLSLNCTDFYTTRDSTPGYINRFLVLLNHVSVGKILGFSSVYNYPIVLEVSRNTLPAPVSGLLGNPRLYSKAYLQISKSC